MDVTLKKIILQSPQSVNLQLRIYYYDNKYSIILQVRVRPHKKEKIFKNAKEW